MTLDEEIPVTFCTGFMALLPTSKTLDMLKTWDLELSKAPQLNQPIFNKLLLQKSLLKVGKLDRQLFPSGDLYFGVEGVRSLEPRCDANLRHSRVVIVHNNWIVGKEKKIQRFINVGLWKDNIHQHREAEQQGQTMRNLSKMPVGDHPMVSVLRAQLYRFCHPQAFPAFDPVHWEQGVVPGLCEVYGMKNFLLNVDALAMLDPDENVAPAQHSDWPGWWLFFTHLSGVLPGSEYTVVIGLSTGPDHGQLRSKLFRAGLRRGCWRHHNNDAYLLLHTTRGGWHV